jgi:hypothetical protein
MQYSPVNMNEALYRGDDQQSLWMNAICVSRKRLGLAFLRDEKLMVKAPHEFSRGTVIDQGH